MTIEQADPLANTPDPVKLAAQENGFAAVVWFDGKDVHMDWIAISVITGVDSIQQAMPHARESLIQYSAEKRRHIKNENDASMSEHQAWVERNAIFIGGPLPPNLSRGTAQQRVADATAAFARVLRDG